MFNLLYYKLNNHHLGAIKLLNKEGKRSFQEKKGCGGNGKIIVRSVDGHSVSF
jgi:hypothetical protein